MLIAEPVTTPEDKIDGVLGWWELANTKCRHHLVEDSGGSRFGGVSNSETEEMAASSGAIKSVE